MLLRPPMEISARLLPAVRIGDSWISLDYRGDREFKWYIDTPIGEFSGTDFRGPACGDMDDFIRKSMESFLGFLDAFVEAIEYTRRTGRESENADLFPAELTDWAVENRDEILLKRLDF